MNLHSLLTQSNDNTTVVCYKRELYFLTSLASLLSERLFLEPQPFISLVFVNNSTQKAIFIKTVDEIISQSGFSSRLVVTEDFIELENCCILVCDLTEMLVEILNYRYNEIYVIRDIATEGVIDTCYTIINNNIVNHDNQPKIVIGVYDGDMDTIKDSTPPNKILHFYQ